MKISNIIRKITKLPRTLAALLAIAVLAAPAIGGYVTAADQVLMEGNVQSLNASRKETVYKDETNLLVDEVAQIQLWHHNRQAPGTTAATNTVVKFAVPNAQGKTQVVSGTSSSDNGNTISDTTQINLSLDRARLQYVTGSAKFRYNKGAVDGVASCITGYEYPAESCYATVSISDDVIANGVNLDQVRGAPLNGCNAYHETVTIQVRSVADVVSVNKYVRHVGQGAADWATSTTAKPGDDLEYLIRFKNEGNTQLNNVMVGDNLPKYNSYVDGSTMLSNSNHPSGIAITNDSITKGGINVGNYVPGAVGYVWFKADLDPIKAYEKCGTYEVVNVGVVRPEGMNEHYNTASVKINVECREQPKEPVYACDALKLTHLKDRTYRFDVSTTAKDGATVKSYTYNFADGSNELLTDKASVEHTYAKDGTYKPSVKVTFDVNGEMKTVSSDDCAKTVTVKIDVPMCEVEGKGHLPKDSPDCKVLGVTTLPNTGMEGIAGVFASVTAAGAALHRKVTIRRRK
ncbi:DUF11 domain-containing protein [Candidatus Saccharibacteria bacterium]|nr:DUF11 domain-containing protein [Candidatus Saccharibacteria bacterium]